MNLEEKYSKIFFSTQEDLKRKEEILQGVQDHKQKERSKHKSNDVKHKHVKKIPKVKGAFYDHNGFYILPDGDFYDQDGWYFDKNGYDKFGGSYDEATLVYIPGKGKKHSFREFESQID